MKQFFIITFLLFIPLAAVLGQKRIERITYSTQIGSGLSMSSPSFAPFTWQIMSHYHITPCFAIGAGTGISVYKGASVYEKKLISLYTSAQFFITRPQKLTPYIECNAGGAFAPDKEANGGFYFSPSVGIQFKVFPRLRLHLAIGYELQKLSRIKKNSDACFRKEFQEQLSYHSIMVKIGVTL